VIGIYLDLQKAFDTVNHEILLYKMFNYGIRGVVHEWFESYLSDRQQFTVVASAHLGLAKITGGVSQGSVLGPLLFLL
jgi:ribonucleases P/MRP protein subunit RPP40